MALSSLRARKRCPLGAGVRRRATSTQLAGGRAGCPGLRSRLWRTGRNLGVARTVPCGQVARKARVHRRRTPAISPACRGGDSDFEAARLVGVIGDPASVRETTAEPSTAWVATNGAGWRTPVTGRVQIPSSPRYSKWFPSGEILSMRPAAGIRSEDHPVCSRRYNMEATDVQFKRAPPMRVACASVRIEPVTASASKMFRAGFAL